MKLLRCLFAALFVKQSLGRGLEEATEADAVAMSRAVKAADVQLSFYDWSSGLFPTTGWWNAANVLTAMADFMLQTSRTDYVEVFQNTVHLQAFEKNRFFRNEYYDDTLWWGLAFTRAYDVTRNETYLKLAEGCAEWVNRSWDEICGGGVYWRRFEQGKNAIGNGLFLKLAAAVGNRLPEGEEKFRWLRRAERGYDWFRNAGYYNEEGTINDGLVVSTTEACTNNGGQVYSYNQGVVLGALVELARAFPGNETYLQDAVTLADASLNSDLNPTTETDTIGVLIDVGCTAEAGCGNDGPSFKGVFMRNLGELNRALPDHPYTPWIRHQGDVIVANNMDEEGRFGVAYTGPPTHITAASHHSGFEALIAGLRQTREATRPPPGPEQGADASTTWLTLTTASILAALAFN